MTPKQTALANTLGLIATGMGGGLVCGLLLTFFTFTQIGIVICVALFVWLIKFVYEIELDKAQRLERLNNPET